MPADLDAVRARGKSEYFSYKGKYVNPYQVNSPEFNAYERGWMQSLKDNGGKLVDLDRLSSGTQSKLNFNLYAERKGRDGPRKL